MARQWEIIDEPLRLHIFVTVGLRAITTKYLE